MWSNFRVFVKTRAAEFCTSWSFLSCCSVIPFSKAFPLSRRDVTKACIKISAVSLERSFLMLLRFLIWKYADWHTFLIWFSIDILESRYIPKFLTLLEAEMVEEPIWICVFWILFWAFLDDTISSSVLSSFNFNLLLDIHDFRGVSRRPNTRGAQWVINFCALRVEKCCPHPPPLNMTYCETRHCNFVNMSEIFIQTYMF